MLLRFVVAQFLAEHADAHDGTPQWDLRVRDDPAPGLRIVPGEADMDGFYYACIDKNA